MGKLDQLRLLREASTKPLASKAAVRQRIESSAPPKVKPRGAGRPRIDSTAKTLKEVKPWEKCKPPMSRSTWFRRQAEKAGRA